MKKITLLLSFMTLLGSANIQAQGAKKSPPKSTEGKIGDVKITINYNAPSVRGREIFGDLVAYDKVWRAGANEATTIEFSKDVKINGMKLKAGKYAFFTMPKEKGDWPIMLNSEAEQWGAYNMDESKNIIESTAKATEIEAVEMLRYSISDGMIHLEWATTRISFKVE